MKLRFAIILIFAAVLLSACSLASDITPPPDYVAPPLAPTLGLLSPASAPDVQSGASIYSEKCAACHGDKGLGDGPQSQQLPYPVAAIGLPEKGQLASPAQWFSIVTEGNMSRFMPPFSSLDDQQRWDVVSYVLTMHTTPDQIAKGKSLFDANCPNCADKFSDQTKMAALSESDLVNIIKQGNADVKAFGSSFSDANAYAVAAYLRTLTFSTSSVASAPSTATPTTAPVLTDTATTVSGTPSEALTTGTPSTSPTPSKKSTPSTPATQSTSSTPGTPATSETAVVTSVAQIPGTGIVTGSAQISGGGTLPDGTTVILHGLDSDPANTSATPQDAFTAGSVVKSDGTFTFENVELKVNRTYRADVSYKGVQFQSSVLPMKEGQTKLTLPPVTLYDSTNDTSLLTVQQLHLYSDFATQGTAQFIEIYSFSNKSNKAVIISTDGVTIPFIKLPEGAQNAGYQVGQNTVPFVNAGQGVAVIPSDTPYAIIQFFGLPYNNNQADIKQPFGIDDPSLLVLIPDGMTVKGSQLTSMGITTIQNVTYQEFSGKGFKTGDTLTFTVSGSPKTPSAATASTATNPQQGLFIGIGALGLALIVAGVWLFMRDRRRNNAEDDENEFESADDVMDAILALDDLHRAGKIPDAAYKKRRAELKAILKEMA